MATDAEARADRIRRDPRWAALLARDAREDGRFFYAVRTTGVYCRPSCGARAPRPENVEFHDTPAAAERAGFRPCRRCRPDQPDAAARHAALVAGLCRRIETAETAPALAELAREAGMSANHLRRVFQAVTGLTPKSYAAARRAGALREGLAVGKSVTGAAYEAGFNSSGRLYADSAALLGMQPKRYRAGGRGEAIRFALGQCSLGAILVAATGKGVCAILLGDDADALSRAFQDRFPQAELIGGNAEFEGWVARVVGLVETPALGLDLPLDIRGTAFQQRVWQALRAIPPGTTLSYSELAMRLGLPRSARAVAAACAANTLAVAIPCHRVVRIDGDPAGYRWGVARKQALIEREADQANREETTS